MIVYPRGQPPEIICEEVRDMVGLTTILYAIRGEYRVIIGSVADKDRVNIPLDWIIGEMASIEIDWPGVVSALDALSLRHVPQPE